MDLSIEQAVLKYVSSILNTETGTLLALRDGKFFAQVLSLLDDNLKEELLKVQHEDEVLHQTKSFLTEYYSNAEDFLNFEIVLSNKQEEEEAVKFELAKIAVVLLCVGILDSKRQIFIDSALGLPVEVQENIMLIIKSVLGPDSSNGVLTKELENVLLGIPGSRSATPTNMLDDSRIDDTSAFGTPEAQTYRRDSNSSVLNYTLWGLTSPFKSLDLSSSSSSPFVDFIQSPQLVQKAVLKQKEIELKKLQQQLSAEVLWKEDYKLKVEEHQAAIAHRDAEIESLKKRVTDLLTEKDLQNREMSLKFEEARNETIRLREQITSLAHYKAKCEDVEKENKSLSEDIKSLQQQILSLQGEHTRSLNELNSMDELRRQYDCQYIQVEELRADNKQLKQDKGALQTELTATRDGLHSLRQEMVDLQAKHEEESASKGESMGVVLDIQLKEMSKELEKIRLERDTLKQQLKKVQDEVSSKDEQIQHKMFLWEKSREANQVLSQALGLERDTVVKMKARMENYIAKYQDMEAKAQELAVKNQNSESEKEKLQKELKSCNDMLHACRENLKFALLKKEQLGGMDDSTFDVTGSPSDFIRKPRRFDSITGSIFSGEQNESNKLYSRINSAPVLPRQRGSTVSLQSVQSMMEYHSALLPNASSCVEEPESPPCEWNRLSRLNSKVRLCKDEEDPSKRPKRKGLSSLSENISQPQIHESPAKLRKKGGGTTVYFPLDPNGPVYPPAKPGLSTGRQYSPTMQASKFLSLSRRATSCTVLTPAFSSDGRPPLQPFPSTHAAAAGSSKSKTGSVSKYTPAKRSGKKLNSRQQIMPPTFNLK